MKTCEKCGRKECTKGAKIPPDADDCYLDKQHWIDECHGHESVTVPKDSWEEEFDKMFVSRRIETGDPNSLHFSIITPSKEDLKSFIRSAISRARYEGAKGCAEAIEHGRGGFPSDHKNPFNDFWPNSQSSAYTTGVCDMMFQLRKQANAYAESLMSEKV